MSSPSFYLVQRLKHREQEGSYNFFGGDTAIANTLNSSVYLDYMGSSEFEFGAPAESANRLTAVAAAGRLAVVHHELEYNNGAVITPLSSNPTSAQLALHRISLGNYERSKRDLAAFFVVDEDKKDDLLEAWGEWMNHDQRTREPMGFMQEVPKAEEERDIVGWWALSADLIWTLDESRAQDIKIAFERVAEETLAKQKS